MSSEYRKKLIKLASFYDVSEILSIIKKNKRITIAQIELLLKKNSIKLPFTSSGKKSTSINQFKSFYYTFLSSVVIIFIFFVSPAVNNFVKKNIHSSKEFTNNSKNNLKKVLDGEPLEKDQVEDDGLNTAYIFEDIFQDQSAPSDIVRLNASTLFELFRETKYNLDDVRRNKLVRPVSIRLLPNEMRMIESTQKRKELFIQIILPLILEENNKLKIERKKLFRILNKSNNSNNERKWLKDKMRQYGVSGGDLSTLKVRIDEIPVSLAIAQAAKETGWGTSRFALEGNALFGQWTFSGDGLKPLSSDSEEKHKVMKFKILQASVRAYQRNLNTHKSYKKFRKVRAELRDDNKELDSLELVNYLQSYAATGQEYVKILKKIIKQNSLTDFDDVRLMPTSTKLKNLI